MSEQSDAFAAIENERDFQDAFLTELRAPLRPTIEMEILLLEEYIAKARKELIRPTRQDLAGVMENIRIVGALAVRAMESHGVTERDAKSWALLHSLQTVPPRATDE